MMATCVVDGQQYEFIEDDGDVVTLRLAQADMQSANRIDMESLHQPASFFVAQSSEFTEQDARFSYDVHQLRSTEDVLPLQLSERLRLCHQLLIVRELADTPFTTVMHPLNIRFTYDGQLRLLYRGFRGELPPEQFNTSILLQQCKALVSVLVSGSNAFAQYYEGGAQLAGGLLTRIADAHDFDELSTIIQEQLIREHDRERHSYIAISKVKHMVTLQVAIWASVIAGIALLALGYWQFYVQPEQQRNQQATTAFLQQDYAGVQQSLQGVSLDDLDSAQRYELAYSAVQSAALSRTQRDAVLKNVSMTASRDYLDFWIENGRGNLQTALDIAKRTEDADLILYSLSQQISSTKNSTTISGADKERTLTDLQKQYDTYNQKRQQALNGADSAGSANE